MKSLEKKLLLKEAGELFAIRIKPKAIFVSLIDSLKLRKIQLPTFFTISELITNALKIYENELLNLINSNLTSKQIKLMNELLKQEITNKESKIHRYKGYNPTKGANVSRCIS